MRTPITRAFSSSRRCQVIKRLPSLAAIRAVDISKYRKESPEYQQAAHHQRNAETLAEASEENTGLIKSFLYGSTQARIEAAEMEQSFSQQLMRGKYVHEVAVHDVIPAKATDYVKLLESVYPRLSEDPNAPVRLVGSWRTVIGDMDQYVHIWEYNGYAGFHSSNVHAHRQNYYLEYLQGLRECLRNRRTQIVQEFDFWGGTPDPREMGGVFELRAYDLKPGTLAEWEQHWRKGIECRRQVMEPVGAWFSSIGPLNRVYHLWQFVDLEHRKISRQKCWQLPGWAETTHETVKLVDHMESQIMVPLDFSPLK